MRKASQLVVIAAFFTGTATAAEPGLQRVITGCEYCHGPDGISSDSNIPIIAGQPEALIAVAHEQFKDWVRSCTRMKAPKGSDEAELTSMCEVSASLDTITINALAVHYSAKPFRPAHQEFDLDKSIEGAGLHQLYCEACHLNGGSEAGFAGRLAGQWTPYLRRMLAQIDHEALVVPQIMKRKLSEFSEAEIDALLHFWASQQE